MQRKPGWYYVRVLYEWTIAKWHGTVWTCGIVGPFRDEYFDEIGPRVPMREEWQVAQRDREAMEVLRKTKVRQELDRLGGELHWHYWQMTNGIFVADDPADVILKAAEAGVDHE